MNTERPVPSSQKIRGRASARKDQALGQELAHQPSSGGPYRQPDGHFALPRRGPREDQVCEVDAPDQQDEPHRAQEHERRPSDQRINARIV